MPSNRIAIVCSIPALIAYQDRMNNRVWRLRYPPTFIVILDACILRNSVRRHPARFNVLHEAANLDAAILRERMGHTRSEIMLGAILGLSVGSFMTIFS